MRPLVSFLVLLAACSEYDLSTRKPTGAAGAPDIELSTNVLQFGPISGGQTDTQVVTVRNVGGATLEVTDLVITSGEQVFSVATSPTAFAVEPGASVDVEVDFTPFLSVNYGSLSVRSDDPDEPKLPVDLLGLGNVPELAIDPQDYTFPSGCEDTVYVRLQNVGSEVLTVSDLAFAGTEMALESQLTLPIEIPAGTEVGVTVRYVPAGEPVANGALDVTSNDPRGRLTAVQAGSPEIGVITESFVAAGEPPIDIVFALDKSGSMSDELGSLANAFAEFIQEIDLVTTDWKIGVVSHHDGCFNNGILTPATPNYQDLFQDAARGIQLFGTDLTEALLALTDVALRETGPAGCNAGFSRADAVLHVVLVSDEPEQSGVIWSNWVAGFQAAKSDPALLVISSVVDMNNSCGSGAAGYLEASAATGGLVLDICNDQWGSYAADLGQASAAALRTFHLSAVPEDGSITVTVDGVTYTTGWHYDAANNAVVVDADLPEGAALDVSYNAVGC